MRVPRLGSGATTLQLFPDLSIFLQIILFIIIWVGLNRLAFDPTNEVLRARQGRTVETEDFAEQLVAAAQTDRDKYERAIHECRLKMAQESAAARKGAQEESSRAFAAARAKATQELTTHRVALAAQVEEARQSLHTEAQQIATDMLERVANGSRP